MLDAGIAQSYIDILHEELVLATGCTEPIAIAYCAATLQRLLGCKAERVEAVLSGNILKNVKSVVVPNTGGRKGIRPAIAAGMAGSRPAGWTLICARGAVSTVLAPGSRITIRIWSIWSGTARSCGSFPSWMRRRST